MRRSTKAVADVLVADASAVVAALTDQSATGQWADRTLGSDELASVHVMPFEVANSLRNLERGRQLSSAEASLAMWELGRLTVSLVSFDVVADRVWELRGQLTAYDASYVALAEWMGCGLVTLDRRIGRAGVARCPILTPPG